MLDNATKIRIRLHFERFLSKKIQSLEELSLSDMGVNPFLIAVVGDQIGIANSNDLARWMVLQRIERGTSTAFGATLKHVAREFCNADPLPDMDGRIERGGSVYNLLITSGPKHNYAAVHCMRDQLQATKRDEPDSVPVLGMCYGNDSSVGDMTKKYLGGIRQMAGRDFWTFLSEDPDCYQNILEIAVTAHNYVRTTTHVTLEQLIRRKIGYVADELDSLRRTDDGDRLTAVLGGMY